MEGALSVSIEITMQIPVSWSKRKQAEALAGLVMPTGRPDLDNLIKALTDACNGIVWRDDAQIVRLMAEKRYGEQPGVVMAAEGAQMAGGQRCAADLMHNRLACSSPG